MDAERRSVFERFVGVLAGMVSAHEAMLDGARAHREAIRGADTAGIERAVEVENAAVQRVAMLEQERRALVAELVGDAKAEVTVREVAAMAGGETGERIGEVGGRLRAVLEAVRREHRAIAKAAASLAGHVEGVMRVVQQRVSGASTYTRGGRMDVVNAVEAGGGLSVDLRS